MQLGDSLWQLKCIMIADGSNRVSLADKLVPDCWLSVQSACSESQVSESLLLPLQAFFCLFKYVF